MQEQQGDGDRLSIVQANIRKNGAKFMGVQQSMSGRSLRHITSKKLRSYKDMKEESEKEEDKNKAGVAVQSIQKIRQVIPISLEWVNLSYSVFSGKLRQKKEKQILKSISGMAAQNRFLAIMGPSGCGKTSLLNSLAGRLPVGGLLRGQIKVNGIPVTSKYKELCAYVQQDDLTYPYLTVRETFTIAANLRISKKIDKKTRSEIVEDVITELGLIKAADTFVGSAMVRGVSGGERKRTSIGIEIIENPSVLFLDEPTTGLDSFQAQSVVSTLWALARNGRTILSVIHQPRSTIFSMFDQLLLIAGGRPIYFGDAADAQRYFEGFGFDCPPNFNPSDLFMDVISLDVRSKASMERSSERINLFTDFYEKKYQQYQNRIEHNGGVSDSHNDENLSKYDHLNNNTLYNNRPYDKNLHNPDDHKRMDNQIRDEKLDNSNGDSSPVEDERHNGDASPQNEDTFDNNGAQQSKSDLYFGIYNPNDIKNQRFDEDLQEQTKKILISANKKHKPGPTQQFLILLWRELLLNSRDLQPYSSQLYIQIFQGIIFGLTYLKVGKKFDQTSRSNLTGLLYVMCIQATVQTTNAVVTSFPKERTIMDRERASKSYNVLPYLLAKFIVTVPIRMVGAIVLGILIYLLAYLERSGRSFFYFMAIIGILSCTAQGVGFAISSGFKSGQVATTVAQPLVLIFVLFSSYYINENNYPKGSGWVRYISYTRFAFIGILYNELKGQENYQCVGSLAQSGSVSCGSCIKSGNQYLDTFGFNQAVTGFNTRPKAYPIVGLTYIFFGSFIILYIIVRFLQKPRFLSLSSQKQIQKKQNILSSIKLKSSK